MRVFKWSKISNSNKPEHIIHSFLTDLKRDIKNATKEHDHKRANKLKSELQKIESQV